jgi:hypothetical protein
MSFTLTNLGILALLFLIQFLACVPWVLALLVGTSGGEMRRLFSRKDPVAARAQAYLLMVGGTLLVLVFSQIYVPQGSLEFSGHVYGAVLQLQLILDFFVLFFAVFLRLWPKGTAVALAAFREGVRQPMFWLLTGFGFTAIGIAPFIPYFTFGEDLIMMKELGYDTLMLVAVIFGTLAASLFISEEIEGRTAVTLMSKPVSRRQFLLGKFLGILLAALFMFLLLGCWFEGAILWKAWLDRLDPTPTPAWITQTLARWDLQPGPTSLLRGVGLWTAHTLETIPGLVLSFCQVMVLVAIAVALSTRMPMVVTMSTVLVIYLLAHLAPVLVQIGQRAKEVAAVEGQGSTVAELLAFTSRLFDQLLPSLQFFRIGPALTLDLPLTGWAFLQYVASVTFYGVLYTFIVLLFGLILFEDRDLA